ncbi:hypothetical protein CFBP6625_21570 [Agrobacterium tumefaciens]|nr:hypothetical protein CFBP6625_21570 [Agrobacterium tumefaciens]
MEKYYIGLTYDEKALVEQIDLRDNHPNHTEGHAAYLKNKELIPVLLKSLAERQAVPQSRRSWWSDIKYNPGRIKASRKGEFERNGRRGEEIYTHPHFVTHLRYFLYGADLPDAVVVAFEAQVGDPRYVTSSDVVPLGKLARDLTRNHGLDKHDAADEFFKLGIDMGLSLDTASSIRQSVMQLR